MYSLQKYIKSRKVWKAIDTFETFDEAQKVAISKCKSDVTDYEGDVYDYFIGSAGMDYYEFRIYKQ